VLSSAGRAMQSIPGSGVLAWDGWRHGGFRPGLVTPDVMVACAVELLSPAWGVPGMRLGYGALQNAAIVAGCAGRMRLLAVALSALVSAEAVVAFGPHAPRAITATESVAYIGTLVVLALSAAGASRLLRLAAEAVDRTAAARGQAEQRRVLHDTALATLTALARGGLDARAEEVRARCARDAAYLRLILQGERLSLASLPVALADAAEETAGIGLRMHPCAATCPRISTSRSSRPWHRPSVRRSTTCACMPAPGTRWLTAAVHADRHYQGSPARTAAASRPICRLDARSSLVYRHGNGVRRPRTTISSGQMGRRHDIRAPAPVAVPVSDETELPVAEPDLWPYAVR